jgi:DNA-binding CsgD family transcriptional regulator
MAGGLVEIVEAAYRVDVGEGEWLNGVAHALGSHVGAGLGVCGMRYRIDEQGLLLPLAMAESNLPPGGLAACQAGIADLPPDFIASTWASMPCDISSNNRNKVVRELTRATYRKHWEPMGWNDGLIVNGLDPTRQGLSFVVWLPKKRKMTLPLRTRWSRIAAHLAAANRLRGRLTEDAEAILTPAGKVEHAEDAAKSKELREELTHGAKVVDRARGKLRKSDPDRAVAEWKGLIAARWTLIDHFESDGRRYLLARRNEAAREGYSALSDREQQALGFAHLGHNNKLIAYEMGISPSTVAVLLHRAMKKLGLRSRADLASVRRDEKEGQ